MLRMKRLIPGRFISLVGFALALVIPIDAATFYVGVNRSHFSPAALTIEIGDTVVWENQDDFDDSHTTTSTLPFSNPDYWNGVLVDVGDTFAHTFNNTGIFNYDDQLDTGTGTITVVLPAVPGVTLDSPRREGNWFLFDATGLTPGRTNILKTSTNLISWTSVSTNVATDSSMTFTNTITLPPRFFRLLELSGQ